MDRRQAAQLEWMRRNYASLTPEQRAIVDAAEGRTAEVSFGDDAPNVVSDLDAASTPIIRDPMAGPRIGPERRRSRADAAVDATTGGQLYTPSENVDAMDVANPPTRRALDEAIYGPQAGLPFGALPDADPRTTRAQRLAQHAEWSAGVDRRAAEYNQATGLTPPDTSVADERGPYPGAGRPGYDRTLTFDEVMASREQAEAERAARMRPMLDADKRDMKAREQWRADNPAQAESLAVGQRERSDDYRKERLLYRMAEQTGMSIEELRANNPQFSSVGQIPARDGAGIPTLTRTKDGMQLRTMPTSTSSMRDAAAQNRISESQAREKAWRSQMMLAGNNPRKNAVNAWNALGEEGLNDWQRLTMAKALRPDIDGTSPLTVEANSAKNAMRLINADMVGQGGLGDTRAQMMAQKQRADAAAYADSQWAQKPSRARTTAARERLMRDIENRFGPGSGIVAAELEVNDTPAQQATGAQSTNPTQVGPPPNPMNPSVPLAVPSRPPGV